MVILYDEYFVIKVIQFFNNPVLIYTLLETIVSASQFQKVLVSYTDLVSFF